MENDRRSVVSGVSDQRNVAPAVSNSNGWRELRAQSPFGDDGLDVRDNSIESGRCGQSGRIMVNSRDAPARSWVEIVEKKCGVACMAVERWRSNGRMQFGREYELESGVAGAACETRSIG